jgi:MFS family permease
VNDTDERRPSPPSVQGALRAWVSEYIAHTRQFSRNANLYVLHVIGMDMIHGSWSVLFNLYLLALGFDIRFVGLRLIVEGVASAVTAVPGGIVSDRIGRKASFILGDGMGAIIGLGLISTRSEVLLLALPAVRAFFGNLHHTSEAAFMAENSRPAERVHLFAVAGSLRTLSAMVGALVAGLIPLFFVDEIGRVEAYRWAVYGGLALWFLSLIPALMLRSYEAEERPERQVSQADLRQLRGLRALFADVRHPRHVFFFVLTSAMIAFGFGAVGPMFNVAFHEGHVHAADSELGFMFAAGELALAVAMLLVPLLAAHMMKVDAIALTRLISMPFVLAMGILPVLFDEGLLLLLLVGTSYAGRTMIFRMGSPLDDAFNMSVLDARERATSTGMELAIGGGMSAVAIYIGSRLMDGGDFTTPFLIMALFASASTLIYWKAFRGTELELLRSSGQAEREHTASSGLSERKT